MVKLFFENTKLPGPVAGVRWCVNKSDLEKLKELGVDKPFLILFSTKKEKDEDGDRFRIVDFKVVLLDQAMEFFEFRSAGERRVFGKLAWFRAYKGLGRNKEGLENNIRKKLKYFEYFDTLIEELNSDISSKELEHGYIDVVVPDGHFAKEPKNWEKWWVNFWYESRPVNQCQFRKRRMLAYSVQPFIMLVLTLMRSFIFLLEILVGLSVGCRRISYRAVFHPFSYSIDWGVISVNTYSVFLKDSSGQDRSSVWLLAMPAVHIGIFGAALILRFLVSLIFATIGSIWLWYLALVAIIIAAGVVSSANILNKFFPEETEEQEKARLKRQLESLYAQYHDMLCSGATLQASVYALPSKKRTFYLKFQDLKRRVCLPFGE